jgi:hypothetical protein
MNVYQAIQVVSNASESKGKAVLKKEAKEM